MTYNKSKYMIWVDNYPQVVSWQKRHAIRTECISHWNMRLFVKNMFIWRALAKKCVRVV